jgi:hypothetical protein
MSEQGHHVGSRLDWPSEHEDSEGAKAPAALL